MSKVFMLSHALTRHLVRGALVALLISQFAWADHLHVDLEQSADCSVCVFVDNSPAVASTDPEKQFTLKVVDLPSALEAGNPLSPPSFDHRSRAPPSH